MFSETITLNLPDADITYYPNVFNINDANTYFKTLLDIIPWQQDNITVYGKTYKQPRLTALFSNNDLPYSYSNITMHPNIFTNELLEIKTKIEVLTQTEFTTCLVNLYRDGQDSNGWHADNEKELGKHPIIASVSFGEERFFHLKHKEKPSLKAKFALEHGSVLLMKGTTQQYWLHQIAKTKRNIKPRINLTFRVIR